VRAARGSDVDAVSTLWREADELHARLSPGFFRVPDQKSGRERAAEALADADDYGHEVILVAGEREGEIRGALHMQIYDTPTGQTMVPQRRGHVESLIVGRAYRRMGCGRALMQAACDWARRRGATQILLTVWAGNDEAQRFYAALGYHCISQVLGTDL
jgi:ribosomal protein S18 acetylase RimI-like enzyme